MLNDEELLARGTARQFVDDQIIPVIEKHFRESTFPVELLPQLGDLGFFGSNLTGYGCAEMSNVAYGLVMQELERGDSGLRSFVSVQSGLVMYPIHTYGSSAQKDKWLPRLQSGKAIGCFGLTEPQFGSNPGGMLTRAVRRGDRYVLNGEKMWITNAGFADLFTVFAKVNGEKFSAFLIERNFPGFSVGAEEHKMGIRGSSTCPIILNDCKVPVENLLGEIGKGHVIAFNILNVGRFKLGAMCVGGGRVSLENAIGYAKQRKAFNKVIADFGLVREKIANMATLLYVGESLVYRTVGMMDVALGEVDKSAADAGKQTLKAIEEYAVECSIIKVWGSEMIDYVVDETVQIYAGYGFVEEYPAERAYRDARINRIFEGTNEINRLIITGFLLKRAMTGQLPLMPAIKKLMDEVLSGPSMADELDGALAEERRLVAQAKKLGLFAAGAATQKYMQAIQDQQEIMGAIADMTIETYAMESAVLRAQKIAQMKGEAGAALPIAMTRVYLSQAMEKVESAARKVIAAVADGDMLRTQLAILRRLGKYEPFNTIELRQQIAQKMIERGKFTLA
jgi:butyryl-CoA dehydrogenase